jgi:hypothetical protein
MAGDLLSGNPGEHSITNAYTGREPGEGRHAGKERITRSHCDARIDRSGCYR